MVSKKLERKNVKKMALTAVAVIGTCTLLFQGVLSASTAVEFKKTDTIPTQYSNDFSQEDVIQNTLPEGYEKANYEIGTIDLEYYQKHEPSSNEIVKEDAAEAGAQALWETFGVNLDGQLIELGYHQATDTFPRPSWYADVIIDAKHSYYFSVDSVTGELLDIGQANRTLTENVSVSFDAELDQNPEEFIAVAQQLAEKHHIVKGAIKTVQYNGQGYSDNDPTISFEIIGENGEIALMTLSRHDESLLGIAYSASYKHTLEFHEKFMEKVRALEENYPQHQDEGAPTLVPIELD